MIRSELCLVANKAPATFNSHRRNGDLPFSTQIEDVTDGTGRMWGRFDIYHAALLIAADNLVSAQGVTWSAAAAMLRESAIHTGVELWQPGFTCARVEFRTVDGYEPSQGPQYRVYRGPLSEIVLGAETAVENYNRLWARSENDRIAVYSLAAVNLYQALVIAKGRAAALHILEDDL